jgi:transposase
VTRDWRDDRIDELEAEVAAKVELEKKIAEQAAQIAEQAARIAKLEGLVQELSERLGQDSRNSHRPPSSDSPESRKKRKDKKGKRGRGGQPGHRGTHRELVPEDKVSKFVDLFPSHCENCAEPLPKVADPSPLRHQHTEVPPVEPETTEWRRHACMCGRCGHTTRAAYDDDLIPASPFGPRLMAIMAMLTGIYHLSRRRTVALLSELLGVRVSLGALSAIEARVSEAVAPAVDEAWMRVKDAAVKHTDGTGWLQAGQSLSLWTLATTAATVFKIVVDGTKHTLRPLYGKLKGILVSDRATALGFWAMERRQVCWAHLLRKFVSFSERDGPAGAIGRELLDYTGLVFEYWRDYRAGKLTREQFVAWMAPVRKQVEAALRRGVAADVKRLSGSCTDILEHQAALWTFIERDDVDPTNNHAEREIRAFVLWRKRSFGTQSERGNLFAERLMTVAHTARKQKRDVLEFLTECCEAEPGEDESPSLFAAA